MAIYSLRVRILLKPVAFWCPRCAFRKVLSPHMRLSPHMQLSHKLHVG